MTNIRKKTRHAASRSTIGTTVYYAIHGISMMPFLNEGMIIEMMPPTDINVGDILVISRKDIFGHRVIRITNGAIPMYEVKGDAAYHPDGKFNKKSVIGVVARITFEGKNYTLRSRSMRIIQYTIAICSRNNLLNSGFILRLLSKLYWILLKRNEVRGSA